MCKVSVLVPVYNVEKYLRQCLDSLAAQTLEDIEFLCLDDGSTDGCGAILDAYAADDARFRVIHKANEGYGVTMNRGLREARGVYVGIVESDDFADAEMFAALLAAAEASQADLVKSNYFFYKAQDGDVFRELLQGCPYRTPCTAQDVPQLLQTDTFVWTSLYRKAFLEENGIWFQETPGASYQDVSFSLKAALCSRCTYLLPEAYLHYRIDNPEASWRKMAQKIGCYHGEFRAYWQFLAERSEDDQTIGAAAAPNMWRIYRESCWPHVQDKSKAVYLAHVANEFRALEAKGLLREALWPQDAWKAMQAVLSPKDTRILSCARDIQSTAIVRAGFRALLERSAAVYLYGAGRVATMLVQKLKAMDVPLTGLLVSQQAGNPPSIDSIPVYTLGSAPSKREQDAVIIAVSPQNPAIQQEIFLALEKAGYRNVIVLTEELRRALA